LLSILSAGTGSAQTTGDISGRVTDASETPLPGVAIEATSPSLPGTRISVTDREGHYRIPAIPPGAYRVRATLSGFRPVDKTCTVTLDSSMTVNLALRLETEERLLVSGETPTIDTTSTTTGTTYTSSVISGLPVDRNYADIVRSNPGVNADRGNEENGRRLPLTIYGATSAENQWIIDGVNTTSVPKGYQGKSLNAEFIEEVEVKTGGYQAEYSRALGGIINVITKAGGNEFHGDAFAYFDSDDTRARRIVTTEDVYGGTLTESDYRADYGVDLGGYVLRDKLWFFGAYDYVDRPGAVYNTYNTLLVPAGTRFYRDSTDTLYSGKLTWNISGRTNLVATALSDPSWVAGAARGGVTNPNPSTWESRREFGGLDFGLRANQMLGTHVVTTAQYSEHRDRAELFGARGGDGPRLIDLTCEGGTPESPCRRPPVANSVEGGLGAINAVERHHSRRDQFRGVTTVYWRGHEIKAGVEYQKAVTSGINTYTGGQLIRRFNERGKVYYQHLFYARSPEDLTPAPNINEPHSYETGFYLQDSWRAAPNVTINGGLRLDRQILKNHVDEEVLGTDQWLPRLGIIWDATGRGSTKIYASLGRFADPLPTQMPIFAFVGATSVTTYNFDPDDRTQDPTVIGHERAEIISFGSDTPVDSNLGGAYQDELIIGGETLISPGFFVGIKGTYRRLGRLVGGRCDLDASSEENDYQSCAILNPGSQEKWSRGAFAACNGLDGLAGECQYGAPATPPARRIYRGIEVLARKSVAEKLWLQASYVYSSLRGNFDGYLYENWGDTTPGWGPDTDYPQFRHNNYGRLYLDRPHTLRLDVSYPTPLRLFVGLQSWLESGAPLDKLGYFNVWYGPFINLVPRGRAGRMPSVWDANVTLGYPLTIGPLNMTLQLYAFNVFNNQVETARDTAYTVDRPAGYPTSLYDPNVPSNNANYGKITGRQAPRLIRGALKISF
jgi:outer membrane receptor protein involved in Fe transport